MRTVIDRFIAGILAATDKFIKLYLHNFIGAILRNSNTKGDIFCNIKTPWVVNNSGCKISNKIDTIYLNSNGKYILNIITKIRVWVGRTPNRSFGIYPLVTIAIEMGLGHGVTEFNLWGVFFLAWGYSQYKFCGCYRGKYGGGGPGPEVPPKRIVDKGFYRYTRNPMYLGHIIFFIGLVITFNSWFAVALLIVLIPWFDRRVHHDETTLEELFGENYLDYKMRVKRWIPYIY